MKHNINDLSLVLSIEEDSIHIANKEKNVCNGVVKIKEIGLPITNDCIIAVMKYMKAQVEDGEKGMAIDVDGLGRLEFHIKPTTN